MKEIELWFVLMQVKINLSEGQGHEITTPVELFFPWFKAVIMNDLEL